MPSRTRISIGLLGAQDLVSISISIIFFERTRDVDQNIGVRITSIAFPGIVTKFHLQLIPAPAQGIRSSGYIYPRALYRTVFEWALSLIPQTDHNTEVVMVAYYGGDRTSPDDLQFLVYFVSMETTMSKAQSVLQQVQDTRPAGALVEWFCQEDSLDRLYGNQQEANPHSHYYYTDNVFLENDVDVTISLEEAFLTLPLGKSSAFWYPMFPHSRRVLPDMALGVQSDHYFCIYAICEAENEAPRYRAWVDEVMDRVRLHAVGAYIGESDGSQTASWYWGKERADRLVAIHRKWDAGRLFVGVQSAELNNQ